MLEWDYEQSLTQAGSEEQREENMKTFEYEALVTGGEDRVGTVRAESQKDAIAQIRDMKMFPTKVREAKTVESYDKDYLEYLAETFGRKLIAWGKALTGEES